jgi:hypothetical protein
MGLLSGKMILGAVDNPAERVSIPEWGGDVLVRGMTGTERDRFEKMSVEMRGNKRVVVEKHIRARVASICLVDSNGDKLFTPKDVEALSEKSGAALDRVFAVAMRLSGMTESEMDVIRENFTKDRNGDSTSS